MRTVRQGPRGTSRCRPLPGALCGAARLWRLECGGPQEAGRAQLHPGAQGGRDGEFFNLRSGKKKKFLIWWLKSQFLWMLFWMVFGRLYGQN